MHLDYTGFRIHVLRNLIESAAVKIRLNTTKMLGQLAKISTPKTLTAHACLGLTKEFGIVTSSILLHLSLSCPNWKKRETNSPNTFVVVL